MKYPSCNNQPIATNLQEGGTPISRNRKTQKQDVAFLYSPAQIDFPKKKFVLFSRSANTPMGP